MRFSVGDHAADRFVERAVPSMKKSRAKAAVERAAKAGNAFLETATHLYITNEDLLFPCVKLDDGSLFVKTTLSIDMFARPLA